MQCFKCLNKYCDTKSYFKHIQDEHELRGKGHYRCMLCGEVLNELGRYKKHIEICFKKNPVQINLEQNEFLEAYNDCEMEDAEIATFKDNLRRSVLTFACKMNANMDTPRCWTYDTISQLQPVVDMIATGINSIVLRRVQQPQEKRTVKDFAESVASAWDTVKTEYKFEKELGKVELMSNFETSALFQGDDLENGNIIMPISFQIKKFLEIPDVFEKIRNNQEELESQNNLNNFINGSLWKEKVRSYQKDDFVIPYHFYVDAAQLNHPLGPHCAKGSEEFNYYSFPTIPTQYQSRLENIFVASLFPGNIFQYTISQKTALNACYINYSEKYVKTFTLEDLYNNLIEIFTTLAHEGLILNINGVETKVFFVCGLFIGDNKESNTILSFVRSFRANYYCRYCRLHREDMYRTTVENPEHRRNRQNYDDDVLVHNISETGVREYSVFNCIPHFHVVDSSAEDITHNIDEGLCHYHLKEILYHFIYQKEYFTLEELNRRIASFPYGHDEKSNVPPPITKEQLQLSKEKFKKRKFSMTAAEMANFIQNITFIIGDLVPEDDDVWHFLLQTVKFYDMSYLPSYNDQEIAEWREEIDYLLRSYINIFDQDLKPVHHMAIHYPNDTKRYGPLRYVRTIRFEGKHKELKGYSKNSNNRINISVSLAKKIQHNFANRVLELRGLKDEIVVKYDSGMVNEKVYWSKLEESPHLHQLLQNDCFFAQKITINGMYFESGNWLPDFSDNKKLHQIIDLIATSRDNIKDIFAVCKTYTMITENEHFSSYCVQKSSLQDKFSVVNISNFLGQHQYPVKVHNIDGKFLFRCRRF